jgi:hypothetical protein
LGSDVIAAAVYQEEQIDAVQNAGPRCRKFAC